MGSPAKRSTFAYSMPYIFGKLWHLAIIWAIRKAFQCILQGVRILLAKYTRISPTSENESYPEANRDPVIIAHYPFTYRRNWVLCLFLLMSRTPCIVDWIGLNRLSGTGVSTALGNVHRVF